MALVTLAFVDPQTFRDQIHFWYGDKPVPSGVAPATVMHGCIVRQP